VQLEKPVKKKIALVLFVCVACTTPLTAIASSAECVETGYNDVSHLFELWNGAVKSGKSENVASLYADGSVLLPTLSSEVRLTRDAKVDYFNHFLAKGPEGTIDSRTIQFGCNFAVDAGLYTFTFKDGSKAQARYTFTYQWTGGTWQISSHHSSLMPEG
jgi:uncharacterized protein (TIGR02246 family)